MILAFAASYLAMAGTAYSDGNRMPEVDRCRRWRRLGRLSATSAHAGQSEDGWDGGQAAGSCPAVDMQRSRDWPCWRRGAYACR